MDLVHYLQAANKQPSIKTNQIHPVIFDITKPVDYERLTELLASNQVQEIHDEYKDQLKEYFSILHPDSVFQPHFEKKFDQYIKRIQTKIPLWKQGKWVYFPWNKNLLHILEEESFFTVRTARNRNLITQEEQLNFYNATIGIAGLSVGNSVALAIVLQGGAKHIKLADFDRLSLSNTNRIRGSIESIGQNKCEMTAQQIFSLNPYAEVEIFTEGLTPENIKCFFQGTQPLDLVIDEIDNLAVKCLIREHAKLYKLPVLMAADNGDNGVIDIERYDLEPDLEYFHGRMGEVSYQKLLGLSKREIGNLILKHVGPENVPPRMIESLQEMGKTLVSWPQLGGAALLNGSAVAYCARKILNHQPIEHNRAHVSLDEKLSNQVHNERPHRSGSINPLSNQASWGAKKKLKMQ